MPANNPPRALLLALLVALGACTHENPLSLQLQGNIAMVRLPGAGLGISGQCLPKGQKQFRSTGVFDLMVTNTYDFFPRMMNKIPKSQLISGMGPQSLRLDASTVFVEGAQVTLELDTTRPGPLKPLTGTPLWRTSWFSPFFAQLVTGTATGSKFTLIPPDVGTDMIKSFRAFPGRFSASQQAILKVRLLARMADGTAIESNTIPYPVTLCWGCLMTLPVAMEGVGIDPALQFAECSSKNVGKFTKNAGKFTPPCMPGNDEYIPCQFYCLLCDKDNSCDDTMCPTL